MRLHFKERAFRNKLLASGHDVAGILCFRNNAHNTISLKLRVGKVFLYVYCKEHIDSNDEYELLMSNIYEYTSSLTNINPILSVIEFIKRQIRIKILFDNSQGTFLKQWLINDYSKVIEEKYSSNLDFLMDIDNLDLSSLFSLDKF